MQDFIEDYEEQWGVRLIPEDAILMMSLFDGLSVLMDRYGEDDRDDWCPPPLHQAALSSRQPAGTVNLPRPEVGEFSTGEMGHFQTVLTILEPA